ncbi:hypothetical protein QBC34DRAFT_487637 [Podospora aff. communis PSN243]|uniref:SMP-30/Gluconolactonase/LRE-like region domain-containing protein n=1 Tax=Podospora aff. communis PSN243 TaxID=3040156 RepID=A0AAV9GAV1_9PEZI|nr:hypothetical protein QBC34DRAFT_487637 [Podospora aff. communis PSN243]
MKSSLLISLLASARTVLTTNPPIRNIHTFPKNHFIENIAVRSNGNLLITSMSVPSLFSIDPTAPTPSASTIHTFPNCTGLSGIAEITPDLFALVTGTWDLANTRATPGSLAIWTVNFNHPPGGAHRIKHITTVANSTILNGIARHPFNPALLMAADSAAGSVWRVNLLTGSASVAFSSPLLQPTGSAMEGLHLGINGLKAQGAYLYFTNSAQKFFGRVVVDFFGNQIGAIQIISNSTAAAGSGGDVVYDDIALDVSGVTGKGDAWIASHPDYAVRVAVGAGTGGGEQVVVRNETMLLNPTAAAFGRGSAKERRTLYVTNGGEFTPEFELVNGGVVALDL